MSIDLANLMKDERRLITLSKHSATMQRGRSVYKLGVITLILKVELPNHQRCESINSLSVVVADVNYTPDPKIGLKCFLEGFYGVMHVQRETGFNDPRPSVSSLACGPNTTYQEDPLCQCVFHYGERA